MSTPPRRPRTGNRRSQPDGSGGWLPTIAMGLGVIVAGLGIGALVAVMMQRNTAKAPTVAAVTSAPTSEARQTRAPIAIATIEPPRTPRPTPTPAAYPSPSPTPPAASPLPSPAKAAVPKVSSAPQLAQAATAEPATPAVSPLSAAAAPSPAPTEPSTPAPTPTAPAAAVAVTPEPASSGTASAYDEHAATVVRRYIGALIRGDQKTAYAALGDTAGTSAGALTERSFLDASARIVSVKVTRIDASNASVGCEIAASKGHYYGTYHVTAGSGGPYISEHDYIKV